MRFSIRRFFVFAGVAVLGAMAPSWTGSLLGPGAVRAEMADVEIRAQQQPYRPRRAPTPFNNPRSGRFLDFSNVFGGGGRRSLPPVKGFGEFGNAPFAKYELAPAEVSVAIAYAHRRQYANRAYQYFHHYPYNYFGHPYRPGFRISLTE